MFLIPHSKSALKRLQTTNTALWVQVLASSKRQKRPSSTTHCSPNTSATLHSRKWPHQHKSESNSSKFQSLKIVPTCRTSLKIKWKSWQMRTLHLWSALQAKSLWICNKSKVKRTNKFWLKCNKQTTNFKICSTFSWSSLKTDKVQTKMHSANWTAARNLSSCSIKLKSHNRSKFLAKIKRRKTLKHSLTRLSRRLRVKSRDNTSTLKSSRDSHEQLSWSLMSHDKMSLKKGQTLFWTVR